MLMCELSLRYNTTCMPSLSSGTWIYTDKLLNAFNWKLTQTPIMVVYVHSFV